MLKFHRIYECPRGSRCTQKEIASQKSAGFTDPYRHYVRCFGFKEALNSAVKEIQNTQEVNQNFKSVPTVFSSTLRVTNREKCIYGFLKLIICRTLPSSIIEDNLLRTFLKYNKPISIHTLKSVLF